MWGDLNLIEFFPKNWQASMFRSMHPWLLHTSMWHYWLWFTFIFSMNLFFIYINKTITYQKSDIRGTKSTGEKRRLAWPEMLIVIIPFYWAINIVTNALVYLRILEGSCGHVLLSVQVNAFQWGWKYCYSDLFYLKYFNNPLKIGYRSNIVLEGSNHYPNRTIIWDIKNKIALKLYQIEYDINEEHYIRFRFYDLPEETLALRWKWNVTEKNNSDLIVENYFCRNWLKKFNIIENENNLKTKTKKWQHGYWITSQGLDPNNINYVELLENEGTILNKINKDPFRLLRSSGSLVLPTRSTIRLMACSDDITHSWAVPGLGFKMDCVPGRVFCLYLNVIRDGIYYGQCSELCGWNHYNMPVIVYAIPSEHFIIWWETELHNIFNKKYYNFTKEISEKDTDYITYKLLNYKFK